MVWKDCFERELKQGEDVIIGFPDNCNAVLRSGIVIELSEDAVLISFNFWIDGKEYVDEIHCWRSQYPDGIISRVYKIFN